MDNHLDVDALQSFMLVNLDHAAMTVEHRLRSMRHMAANGFDWQLFLSSSTAAVKEAERWLAAKKLAAGRSTLHNYQFVLNDVAAYQAVHDDDFEDVWFETTKPLYGHPDPYSRLELVALTTYRCANSFTERRRRALIWLCLNTRLRRTELQRINVEDLDERRAVLRVPHPAKGGKPRSLPMPRETWSPARPVAAYLAARGRVLKRMKRDVPGLWISQVGAPLGINMLSRETFDLSRELGFAVSYNRFRRTGATKLLRLGVGLPAVQFLLGHRDPRSTMHYYDPTCDDVREDLERCHIAGFTA